MSVLRFLVLSVVLLGAPALAADRGILVLDASGSMWGQIDGTSKIEIARETLAEVLRSVPENQALGLLAYGHRRKGDCADIEVLVEPAVGTGAAIATAAASVQPKGKTPLSDAVARAADLLKYTEDAATVILITDGLETCDRDPCALAKQLADTGVDFTAHVVGFGLTEEEGKKVACLAENTGGLYLQASDATQLGEALQKTVLAAPPPEPEPEEDAPPPPAARLEAPRAVPQAESFRVTWDGPGDRYDSIEIFDPAARGGEGKVLRRVTLARGDRETRTVELPAPSKLGTVQLRYWDGRRYRVLATREIEVVPGNAGLEAPEAVEIGRPIVVEWTGPGGRNDALHIFDPAARQGEGKVVRRKNFIHGDFENHRLSVPAPAKVGTYVLRYWNHDNKAVLAETTIEVVEAEVSLDAPDRVDAGVPIRVEWNGPGGRYDAIRLFDPAGNNGTGRRVREQRLRNADFDNAVAILTAPAKPGPYELQYWNGDNKAVLVSRPIEVEAGTVELQAPETIEVARTITVKWKGPGGRYDAVRLWDPAGNAGEGRVVRDKRLRNDDFDTQRARLPAPGLPGAYELQYWNGENKAVLASRPIEVVAGEVTLEAPDEVVAGGKLTVKWTGPGASGDDIQLIDESGRRLAGRQVRHGNLDAQTVEVVAPKAAGEYTLRYWNAANKIELATRPVSVLPPADSAE